MTNTETFAFTSALVFKLVIELLSFVYKSAEIEKITETVSRLLFKKIANFVVKLLQDYK